MKCEGCGEDGFVMDEMFVEQRERKFLGPCCVRVKVQEPAEVDQLRWGIELHSTRGLTAFVKYGDLSLSYSRPLTLTGDGPALFPQKI